MTMVSINLLPEGFKDIQVWKDLSSAIDSVFDPEISGAINALAGLKTLEEITESLGTPPVNPYIGRGTLLLLNNIFGIRALETDLLTNTDLVNFIQFGPQFFKEKGSADFLNFLSFSINALLQQTFLWTEDYINFYPEASLNLGQSESVSDVSLGTGNGVTTTFTMTDPGDPDSSYNPKAVTVPYSGVYKNDWQGNQLQYSTPRTNSALYSGVLTNAVWGAFNTTVAVTATQAGSGDYFYSVTNTSTNNPYLSQSLSAVPVNDPWSMFVVLRAGSSTQCILNNYFNGVGPAANAIASILAGPGIVSGGSAASPVITGLSASQDTVVLMIGNAPPSGSPIPTLYIKPGTQQVNDSILATSAMIVHGTYAGSYIQTTSAPVTVTDYSLSGSQITFSSAPASSDMLTWQDASSNIFNFGVGNGSTTVYNLGVEYNPGPAVYKSNWQGNQLQYSTPRTNMLKNSNTFTSWTSSISGTGTAPVVTASYATGPDGVSGSASRLQLNQGSGVTSSDYCYLTSLSTVSLANNKYTESIWIKSNTGLSQPIAILFSGIFTVNFTIGTSWQKITNTATPSFAGANIYIGQRGSDSHAVTGDFQIAFAQFEQGPSATSYIPTTTIPVTVIDYSLAANKVNFSTAPLSSDTLTWNGTFEFLPIWQPGGTWYPTTQVSIQYDYSKFSQSVATNFSAQQAVVDFYYAIAPINLVINQFLVTLTSKAPAYSNVSVVASIRIYSGNT